MGKPTLAELDILRSLVKFLRWVGGSPLSPSRNYQHLLREPPRDAVCRFLNGGLKDAYWSSFLSFLFCSLFSATLATISE